MKLTGVDLLLWASALIGHGILLGVILVRRRFTFFPVFTALIAMNILRTAVLYITIRLGSAEIYFYTYWALAFIDVLFQLGIAYELAAHVFRPLGVWAPDVRRSFSFIIVTSVTIALCLAYLAAPTTRTVRQAIVTRGTFFASALMGELFVAMLALSVTMRLPWRTHVARLAQGLGIYSISGIVLDAAHSFFASGRTNGIFSLLSHMQMTFYLVCLTYWIVTLALPEPAPLRMPDHLHQKLLALQRRTAITLQQLRTTGTPS